MDYAVFSDVRPLPLQSLDGGATAVRGAVSTTQNTREADESRHTEGRYRSLAAVSLPTGEAVGHRAVTMEGMIAVEQVPDSPIGAAPEELDTFPEEESADLAVVNAEAHLDKIIRLLRASGVDFAANAVVKVIDPRGNEGLRILTEDGST